MNKRDRITNEQTLANCFYGNNWIAAAEREYDTGTDHELCFCAGFSRRVPGNYDFIPEYRFYVTKKRIIRDL